MFKPIMSSASMLESGHISEIQVTFESFDSYMFRYKGMTRAIPYAIWPHSLVKHVLTMYYVCYKGADFSTP